MAVSDWSTTASSNTAIGGINIGENCSPANINNAIRELMAQVKDWYDDAPSGTYQTEDATLTALAGLTTAADKGIYATGSDTFSTYDLSSFGRQIANLANAGAARTLFGAMAEPSVSGSASSGKITIGPVTFTWRDHNFTGSTTASYAYGDGHTYSSWGRAWMSGDDSNASVSLAVVGSGLSSASVFSSSSNPSTAGTLFSIGV